MLGMEAFSLAEGNDSGNCRSDFARTVTATVYGIRWLSGQKVIMTLFY
jgi:hypothetical protein